MARSTVIRGFLARFTGSKSTAPDFTQSASTDHPVPDPTEPGQPNRTPPRRPKTRFLRYGFWFTLGIITGGAGATAWAWNTLETSLPDTGSVFTFVRDGTITIKAADNKILQQLGPATREKLTIQKIPPAFAQAFLSVEDRRFYQHDGVDYQGVLRAITSNLVARDVVEGGSTVTQQLARIVFLTQERSIWRKVKEAMLARKIEQQMNKQQILERYLNLVYLGSGAYGIADAAWVYFSKPVNQLTLAQMATIAGLPPAPSVYSPLVNPDAALARRNLVLQRMADSGYISAAQATAAQQEPLDLKPSPPKRLAVEAPYFTTYVQQELPKYVSPEQLEMGGLIIETSLNTKWQKVAERVVKYTIEQEGPGQGYAQAALVAIDPRNGEVRAMVGGNDFGKSQFNRVTQAMRQPGSTFKALVYATAIAAGFSPYNSYLDSPYSIDGYQPLNAGRKYSGWMSMREALTSSVNVIAVKVLVEVGFDPVIKMAKGMGIKSKLQPVYSLALGSSEVNLLELTSAYGTFAAQGMHAETHGIRRILNRRGEVLYDAKQTKAKRVLDKGSAAIMTWMLENVVLSGTGANASLADRAVAGKTGTSEEARDLWFIGYIPQLVAGVWLGNDDNYPTWGASSTAALVWHRFMVEVTKGMAVEKFPKLPQLEGRKGSIKAKPVAGRVTSGNVPPQDRSQEAPRSRRQAPIDTTPVKTHSSGSPSPSPSVDPTAPAEVIESPTNTAPPVDPGPAPVDPGPAPVDPGPAPVDPGPAPSAPAPAAPTAPAAPPSP